jgi:hypothetical protein
VRNSWSNLSLTNFTLCLVLSSLMVLSLGTDGWHSGNFILGKTHILFSCLRDECCQCAA